jgi:hypothetical protein
MVGREEFFQLVPGRGKDGSSIHGDGELDTLM